MSCENWRERWHELVEGTLDGARRAEAERHLEGCADCRAEVQGLRRLTEEARALPREIEPRRDLFPEIRRAVSGPRRREAFGGVPWLQWAGAAASLLLAAALGIWALRPAPTPQPPATTTAPVPAVAVPVEIAEAEALYAEAVATMTAALEQQRERLSPETRQVLDENLAIIDEAIARVQAAIESDPGRAESGHLLTALYRQKIELLWRASRAPA